MLVFIKQNKMLVSHLGLVTMQNKVLANIILAGDPKQLDAVTKSEQAKDLGLRTSFLEHLCERQIYKRDAKTKQFNGIYITQLVRNYRSHPSILKLPNELFYENSLMPVASEGEILSSIAFQQSKIWMIHFISFHRRDRVVLKLTISTIETIPNHIQIRSVMPCRKIRSQQKVFHIWLVTNKL